MKRVLAVIGIVVGIAIGGGYWLAATDRGTQQLAKLLVPLAPQLSLQVLQGNLRDGLSLQQLHWRSDGLHVELHSLQARLDLTKLWTRNVQLSFLQAELVRITIEETAAETTAHPFQLPTISLPIGLGIDELTLGRLIVDVADAPVELAAVRARGRWKGHRLRLSRLHLRTFETTISGRATIALRGDYPLQADLEVAHDVAHGTVTVAGDLRAMQLRPLLELELDLGLGDPLAVAADAQLDLLQPKLPLHANLELRSPLSTRWGTVERAALAIEGEALGSLRGSARGRFTPVAKYGGTTVSGTATLGYENDQLMVTDIDLHRPQQQLTGQCQQILTDPLALDCSGELNMGHLEPWLTGSPADLQTPWQLSLLIDPDWQLELELTDLQGRWRSRAVTGRLDVGINAETVRVDELRLRIGANVLTASGAMGEAGNTLQLAVKAPRLDHLHSQLAGSLAGQLEGTGRIASPDLRARFHAEQLQWQDHSIAAAELEMDIADAALADSSAVLLLKDINEDGDIELRLTGTRSSQALRLTGTYARQGRVRLGCQGDRSETLWAFSCADVELTWLDNNPELSFSGEEALQLRWQPDSAMVEIEPFCLHSGAARICLTMPFRWLESSSGELAINASELALGWFNQRLPPAWQFAEGSRFDGRLRVRSWQPLRLEGQLTAAEVRATWAGPEVPLELVYDQLAVSFSGSTEQLEATLQARSDQLGSIAAELVVADPRTRRDLAGEIRISDLQLTALAWALPDADDLQGRVDGRVSLTGSTDAPQLEGSIALRDGGAILPVLTHPLAIELTADFDATRARLHGNFSSGDGQGKLRGEVRWPADGPMQTNIVATAQRLALAPLPDSTLVISPSLQLTWGEPARSSTVAEAPSLAAAAEAELRLTGRIHVDRARIVLQELPENAVEVSPDARIVGSEAPAEEVPARVSAQVLLQLGDQFRFEGYGAEARLAGAVDLTYATGEPLQAQGEVTIPQGRYRAYGQRLSVRRGSVVFAGAATAPDLDIEATRDMDRRDIVVGIRLTGTPGNPDAQLFSEPPMPETTAAYYLLTGNPPGEGTAGGDIAAENILTSLGLAGAESPATRLAERLGIRDLQLGTGTGAYGTEAQISAYVLPRLYVRYGVSLEEDAASFTLQYQLTPRLFLEAVSGLDNALDLIYTFERQRANASSDRE